MEPNATSGGPLWLWAVGWIEVHGIAAITDLQLAGPQCPPVGLNWMPVLAQAELLTELHPGFSSIGVPGVYRTTEHDC
jgi:hypothetical protein